ncbi:MAG: hypothetical protein ACLFPS_01805 [Clostridia bacterium]
MSLKTLQVTLNVAESRRLIAKGLVKTKLFQDAFKDHKIILANGITNAFIYEEILDETLEDKSVFTAGIVTNGVACITDGKYRKDPLVLIEGEKSDQNWLDVVKTFGKEDLFIKGANGFDLYGRAGIMVAGAGGGTIGKSYGHIVSAGSTLIIPVGMEKLVPSLEDVNLYTGIDSIDYSIGKKSGVFVISDANIFTELEALRTLFDVEANAIAAGGINESLGSTTFIIKGNDEQVLECLDFIKKLKQEKAIVGKKALCENCNNPCEK